MLLFANSSLSGIDNVNPSSLYERSPNLIRKASGRRDEDWYEFRDVAVVELEPPIVVAAADDKLKALPPIADIDAILMRIVVWDPQALLITYDYKKTICFQ